MDSLSVENLHTVESVLKDYIPGALTDYARLPASQREENSEATNILISQLETLATVVKEIHIAADVSQLNALRVRSTFLSNKFANGLPLNTAEIPVTSENETEVPQLSLVKQSNSYTPEYWQAFVDAFIKAMPDMTPKPKPQPAISSNKSKVKKYTDENGIVKHIDSRTGKILYYTSEEEKAAAEYQTKIRDTMERLQTKYGPRSNEYYHKSHKLMYDEYDDLDYDDLDDMWDEPDYHAAEIYKKKLMNEKANRELEKLSKQLDNKGYMLKSNSGSTHRVEPSDEWRLFKDSYNKARYYNKKKNN